MTRLHDPAWLRARIEAGASVTAIAAETGATPRSVRTALHRHDIPLPREARNAAIDLADVFAQYRQGVPVSTIAATVGVSVDWIADRLAAHNVSREVPAQRVRRRSRFPELDDAAWLRRQLAEGGFTRIADRLGTSATNVRAAVARHGITPPPPRATPLERAAWASDPVDRYQIATRLAVEAQATLDAARALRVAAAREMAATGLSDDEIARLVDR